MAKLIEVLEQLQEVDLKLSRIKQFIENYDNLQKELDQEKQQAKQRYQNEKQKLEDMIKLKMKKELDLKQGEEHIKKCNARLYSVKTNKEYEATLKEIEEQKEKNSQLETELLILYDQIDEEEVKLKEAQKQLEQEEREIEQKKKELEEKLKKARELLPDFEKQRQEIVSQLNSDAYETYTLIQEKFGNPALTRVIDEVCQSCFRRIPSQMYIEVMMGETVWTCPGCHKILVHREKDFLPEDFPY